jgi:hypothetical protein
MTNTTVRRRSVMVTVTLSHEPNRRCSIASWWSIMYAVSVMAAVSLWCVHSSVQAFQINSSTITRTTTRSVSSSLTRHNERRNILPSEFRSKLRLVSPSSSTKPSLRMLSPSLDGTDEEWHPHDPAWTTPQLLEGIWSQIVQAKNMVRNVRLSILVLF